MHFWSVLTTAIFSVATLAAVPADARFDRYFVIVLENTDYDDALRHPYLGKTLLQKGQLLTDYHGVSHPSQPNYVGMISGSTKGVVLNLDAKIKDRKTIVDLLDDAGISWVSYQEHYPENKGCFMKDQYPYVRKHNPFMSFPAITDNPERCAKVKNANHLYKDMLEENVPEYVFYTPDMRNDGHDTDLDFAADHLEKLLDTLLPNPIFKNTLFVVTFDENDAVFGVIEFEKNQVYTVLIGPGVLPGSEDDTYYNHYSQLSTLSKEWNLPRLGLEDLKATPFQFKYSDQVPEQPEYPSPPGWSLINKYFVVVFENTDYKDALEQAYFKKFAEKGRLMTNYHGTTHPSQRNYLAMISGTSEGPLLNVDINSKNPTVVDLLEANNRTWTSYQEAYPTDQGCFKKDAYPYVRYYLLTRKHNPFMSYLAISESQERCARIVNLDQLQVDIENEQVADYVFVTPDMINDGHDSDPKTANDWLEKFIEPLLSNPYFARTLFLVTFDENDAVLGVIDWKQNLIYSALVGPGIKAGEVDDDYYTHYSQLSTLNQIWGIGTLGKEEENALTFF